MIVHRRSSDSVAVVSEKLVIAFAEWQSSHLQSRFFRLHTILFVQVSLTTSDWDECSSWLTALKRLIKARQMLG